MDERLKFVARLLEGEQMGGLCREFGISRKTGYKIAPADDWWAHQDSNLGPMDSLYPDISIGSGLSHHPRRPTVSLGCGTLKPVIKETWHRGAKAPLSYIPQVVSAPSHGVP